MTYHRHTLLGDDPHRLALLTAWLRSGHEKATGDAVELADAIDAGMAGDILEMSRLHWGMLSNWVYVYAAEHVAEKGKRGVFGLVDTATAAVKSEPVRTVEDAVQVAEPVGVVQGSLFD